MQLLSRECSAELAGATYPEKNGSGSTKRQLVAGRLVSCKGMQTRVRRPFSAARKKPASPMPRFGEDSACDSEPRWGQKTSTAYLFEPYT